MDTRDLRIRWDRFQAFSTRVQNLSRRRLALPGHRTAVALILITSAVLAGHFAHESARSDALAAWIRTHGPSRPVWAHSLGSRSYRAVTESSKESNTILRALPLGIDAAGSVWITADGAWVAAFDRENPGEAPLLFASTARKAAFPPTWNQAGVGWEGFDRALETIDRLPKPDAPTRARRNAGPKPDPRAIHY